MECVCSLSEFQNFFVAISGSWQVPVKNSFSGLHSVNVAILWRQSCCSSAGSFRSCRCFTDMSVALGASVLTRDTISFCKISPLKFAYMDTNNYWSRSRSSPIYETVTSQNTQLDQVTSLSGFSKIPTRVLILKISVYFAGHRRLFLPKQNYKHFRTWVLECII